MKGFNPDTATIRDELLTDATEVFQDNTMDGFVWIWEAGDLILQPAQNLWVRVVCTNRMTAGKTEVLTMEDE